MIAHVGESFSFALADLREMLLDDVRWWSGCRSELEDARQREIKRLQEIEAAKNRGR